MGPTCHGVVTVTILEQITEKEKNNKLWGVVFPAQSAILMVFITCLEAPGILLRIKRIFSDLLRSAGNGVRPPRTDPGFPAPGVRMTVVTTNSLQIFLSMLCVCSVSACEQTNGNNKNPTFRSNEETYAEHEWCLGGRLQVAA